MSSDPLPSADSIANATLTNPLGKISAISLFVEDIPSTKAFYKYVFEVPVIFEDETSCTIQFDHGLIVNLVKAAEAESLVQPDKVSGPDAGRRFQLSIWVTDLDAVCEALADKGIKLATGPQVRPWDMRTITFTDPAGHGWEVAQKMGS